MPHLDSSTIRPLYDVHDGGPPVGFRCMVPKKFEWLGDEWPAFEIECFRVTRTLAGMRTHQRIVHGIKLQQGFQFERIEATTDQ